MKGSELLGYCDGDVVSVQTPEREVRGVVIDADHFEDEAGEAHASIEVQCGGDVGVIVCSASREDAVSDWTGVTAHITHDVDETVKNVSLA